MLDNYLNELFGNSSISKANEIIDSIGTESYIKIKEATAKCEKLFKLKPQRDICIHKNSVKIWINLRKKLILKLKECNGDPTCLQKLKEEISSASSFIKKG